MMRANLGVRALPQAQARGHLLLWHALSPRQRVVALEIGLPYRDLSPKLRELFMMASADRVTPDGRFPGQDDVWSEDTLKEAVFQVAEYAQDGWGARGSQGFGPVFVGASREEALYFLRARRPDLTLDDVQPMRSVAIEFSYGPPGAPTVRRLVRLPLQVRPTAPPRSGSKANPG
jgi:hypothetical protein